MTPFLLFAALALAPMTARITGYLADCKGCTGLYERTGERAHWSDRSIGVTDAAEQGRDPRLPRMATNSKWKVTIKESAKPAYSLVYTVRDRCPPEHWHYPKHGEPYKEGCGSGHFDILTSSERRARELGGLIVTIQPAR